MIPQTDFSPLIAADREVNQSSQYATQGLISLGKQITESISSNNMRKEAEAATPIIAQGYQQAFDDINSGNPGNAIGALTQLNTQFGRNAYLNPAMQQMNKLADNAMQNYTSRQNNTATINAEGARQKAAFDQAYGVQAAAAGYKAGEEQTKTTADIEADKVKEAGLNARNAADIASKEKIAGMPARNSQENTPSDLNTTLEAREKFLEQRNSIGTAMDTAKESDDPTAYDAAQQQLFDLDNTAVNHGVNPPIGDVKPFLSKSDQKEIKDLQDKIKGGFFSGKPSESDVKKYEKRMKEVYDKADASFEDSHGVSIKDWNKKRLTAKPKSQSQPSSNQSSDIPTITSKEQFDSLPSGARYIGSNGKKHQKP